MLWQIKEINKYDNNLNFFLTIPTRRKRLVFNVYNIEPDIANILETRLRTLGGLDGLGFKPRELFFTWENQSVSIVTMIFYQIC